MTNSVFASAVNDVAQLCHEVSMNHGFWIRNLMTGKSEGNFAEKIALIHSELSEALEKHRKTLSMGLSEQPDEHCPEHTGIAIELADVVIRVFDLAHALGYQIGEAIEAKIKFNMDRPHRHGKGY